MGHLILFFTLVSLISTAYASPTLLFSRSDCTTQTVASGDSCASLASKCGISAQELSEYNSNPNLCSTLAPGERICCSSGTLPDITPKASSNGTCATYLVKSGDTCSSIAAGNGLSVDDLSTYNTDTWLWSGCNDLLENMIICLSAGSTPLPQPVDNAICGPTVNGSVFNASISLAEMNPCPLNACCSAWGQCGITPEFCATEYIKGNNSTTLAPGRNGCISNCGTDIKISGKAPSSFINVGYYESWNYDRPCLNMRSASLNYTNYTHVHWAFGTVGTSDKQFAIVINDTNGQWPDFVNLTSAKRILSIGGWGFSTDPTTYDILRQAMQPSNADQFATQISNFIMYTELDGVDIDWEYPGATDIPGITPGSPDDPANYLAFLKILRSKLRSDKSISIAAPASYWYLKNFPISEMSQIVDYIVYMTYDLAGQWDYGNQYAQDGCGNGDCLRSHVNFTETVYALSMITKAGAVTEKIVVGLPSYGRSFTMAQVNCTDPTCHYQGPDTSATPGWCTATPGILANAEIDDIIHAIDPYGSTMQTWYDFESESNILVYNDTQWVAFVNGTTREKRMDIYKGSYFLGTADWAIDLAHWHYQDENDPSGLEEENDTYDPIDPRPDCNVTFNTIEEMDGNASSIPDYCQTYYAVATLATVLNNSLIAYQDLLNNDYDDKFQTYAKAVSDSASSGVEDFMNNNGSSYFTCVVPETTLCCNECSTFGGSNSCAYCNQGECYQTVAKRDVDEGKTSLVYERDSGIPGPDRVLLATVQNISEPCPPDYSKRGAGPDDPYMQSVYWTLPDNNADRFYADLMSSTGIPKNKTTFENRDRGNACAPSAQPGDNCWATGYDYNIPVPNGYGASDVANPKDIVQQALNSSDNIQSQMQLALLAIEISGYPGDISELIDAVSIPVLMIADAVDSMSQVEQTADQITEEQKKALILAFLGALLFFIPIAGEVLGSVTGIAEIASILTMVSVAGDAAMGIYSIVEDPSNPLMGIIGIVLAPLALANLAKVAQASDLRRVMSDTDIAKLGGKIGPRLKSLQKIVGVCRKVQ